ncbi:putative histone H2A.Z-specific chaperone chz1 [Amylocarpus encephaloides]|uniref:Histone H2A.Z-specific chaperone chz1 n=1 Tax=Amylocarpus encephaloides TaxID=45428 RepID=A0A9P8C7L2_9HELO|nr:putative histone H2A.Z-specific chaperone chz1 [Amylocarpus encephaloides]
MSAQNGSATQHQEGDAKGKGKAIEPATQEITMDEDDSSSEEEVDEAAPVADEPDDDNMEEIDPDNIIPSGRRTRGKQIDFVKAAAETPADDDEEDEEDDDFEQVDEDSKMEE